VTTTLIDGDAGARYARELVRIARSSLFTAALPPTAARRRSRTR
jgi:hypothetical protein